MAKAEKDAEEARNVARDFQKFQKETYERKAQSYEAEIAQLKQAKKEALSQGDGDRAVEIDDKIDNLKEEVTAAKAEATKAATPPPSLNPELNSWLEKNEWFGTDKRLTGVANGIGEALRAENPALQGQAFLDKLDEELSPYLSPKTKARENTPNPVEGRTSTRPATSKKQSYDNLPAEAKSACDKFVKQGLLTREQYLADYDWS